MILEFRSGRRNTAQFTTIIKNTLHSLKYIFVFLFGLILSFQPQNSHADAHSAEEKEIALWGGTLSRNMVSDEKNILSSWNYETGENIKWTAELGSQSYAGPLIIGGKVFVGTNNEALLNPKLTGDRGNIVAFNEADGNFFVADHTH